MNFKSRAIIFWMRLSFLLGGLLAWLAGGIAYAQDRITGPVDPSRTVVLKGNIHPRAQAQYDRGPVDASMELGLVTLMLKPSSSQQASLDKLLADQQNPSSPDYHRWLTPEQFADRYGVTSNDMAQVRSWLESQGLQVDGIARGRQWITFGGTAERLDRAFHTEIHRYSLNGESHFANSIEPSIPEAFESVVAGLRGLNDFGPKPMNVVMPLESSGADYTSGGRHFLAPDDLATIYDFLALHNASLNGTGQKIAIVGTTGLGLADEQAFHQRFNLPANDPQLVLTGPDPGNVGGDALIEANLDIEWAGAVAPQATIVYVYAMDVFAAAQYAIDQNLAPVLTMSYGVCENETDPGLRGVAQQANAQGITWLASSGDSGAADCDPHSVVSQSSAGFAVNFPASLPEVTSVGGSEFVEGAGNYWAAANSANSASALSYIPESAWNDTLAIDLLASTGGGSSIYFSKPAWQTGPGVPNDSTRDVPDVSLAASALHDGYFLISGGLNYSAGGTSVAAPAWAGIVALLNQSQLANHALSQPGLGNINATLYHLGRSSSDAFHDITSGDNIVPCEQASPNCSNGSLGYAAGPGYDRATGLGSPDVANLVREWNNSNGSVTTLTANPSTIGFYGGLVQLTATVNGSGGLTPTGTVVFVANNVTLGTATVAGSGGGTATASVQINAIQLGLGNQTVTAVYSGDSNLSSSAGSATVTVNQPSGSAVVASVTPNPVLQHPPDAGGFRWTFTITLSEQAGVPTTLTGLTIGGVNYSSDIKSFFGSANIPANGVLTVTLGFQSLNTPVIQVFTFSGMDASGQQWSQQVSVQFVSTLLLEPYMVLSSTPGTVLQNPAANPACQWSQQLMVQEQSGFGVELTRLTAGGNDMSTQIQQIFGTTRLAPFGSLEGNVCFSGLSVPATKAYELDGTTVDGGGVTATMSSLFGAPATTPATMSVSPSSIYSAGSASASVNLTFSVGAPAWTVSVLPSNRSTSWLTASPLPGIPAGQLLLGLSGAGLSNGVYSAMLVIQAVNAIPQYINVPVTLVVGASSATQIGGVSNGASFQTVFAPGMVMSVFGSQLAPAGTAQSAGILPLPLTMAGVSATVNGVSAPFYYASPGQLNIQIPYETGAGTAVLGVNNNGQVASFPFQVAITAPGIFTAGNGSLVPFASGKAGDVLLLFMTGDGDLTPTLETGATPTAGTATSKLPRPRMPVTLTVGGVNAPIQFVGVPTGLAGVTQINFVIPQNVPLGVQPVVVTVGGVQSQAATVTVTQ